jgi:hypothetical protein
MAVADLVEFHGLSAIDLLTPQRNHAGGRRRIVEEGRGGEII